MKNCGTVVTRLVLGLEWTQVGAALTILATWGMMDPVEALIKVYGTYESKHLRRRGFCLARLSSELMETFMPEKMDLRMDLERAASSLAERIMTE